MSNNSNKQPDLHLSITPMHSLATKTKLSYTATVPQPVASWHSAPKKNVDDPYAPPPVKIPVETTITDLVKGVPQSTTIAQNVLSVVPAYITLLVIGEVTCTTARILVELANDHPEFKCTITCIKENIRKNRLLHHEVDSNEQLGKVREDTENLSLDNDSNNINNTDSAVQGKQFSATLSMSAHRARVFKFDGLTPNCLYKVEFSDLAHPQPQSSFKTFIKDWPISAAYPFEMCAVSCNLFSITKGLKEQDIDMWDILAQRAQKHEIDLLVHIGDQIYADEPRSDSSDAPNVSAYANVGHPNPIEEAAVQDVELSKSDQFVFKKSVKLVDEAKERIKKGEADEKKELDKMREIATELYRQLYRESWSHPSTAMTLANVPNLMIYDDHDFRDNWGVPNECDADINSSEYFVGRCAQQAYFEYQRQLYQDIDFTKILEYDRDHHFHVYGEHGIIFTESRSATSFRKEDTDKTPFLGWRQWEDIEAAVAKNGIMEKVRHLTVITPCPIVYLPHKLNHFLGNYAGIEDALGHWAAQPFRAEQKRMLNLMKQWQEEKSDRTVTFVGGDVHVGGHTTIYYDQKPVFQQLVTSAIANYVLPKAAFFVGETIQNWSTDLGDGWAFQHSNYVRERNFGHLTITGRPEAARPYVPRRLVTAEKGEAQKDLDNVTYAQAPPPQLTEPVVKQKITQTIPDKDNLPDQETRVKQDVHAKEVSHEKISSKYSNFPKQQV